jgi:beta-lactamase regulating signal transducer with metallopeptidase domain
MGELLLTLGALTLGGSAAVLLFALVSQASRARYGARWRCWIWTLLCLRLAVPVSLVPQSGAAIQVSAPADIILYQSAPAVSGDAPRPLPAPSASAQASVPSHAGQVTVSLSQTLFWVWLAGMGVCAVWVVFSHLRFCRFVRRWSRPVEDSDALLLYHHLSDQLELKRPPTLRLCANLNAPMLAGLFRPVLLLPEELPAGKTLRCALLHELTHFKRRDIWRKALALAANLVHWFNPVMWYMVRLVERDTELACDEAVLTWLVPEDRAAYGRSILDAVEQLNGKRGA